MAIEIKEVKTEKELKQYIKFPFKLHKKNKYWTPPLFVDEYAYYNPKRNRNLRKNPYKLLLAYKDGELQGRVMGLINESANKRRNEKYLRWTFLDVVDDEELVNALLKEL